MGVLVAALATLSLAGWGSMQNTPRVSEAALGAHLEFLANDSLEGRGAGQWGGDLTMVYLRSEMACRGLQLTNHGSFLQPVKIAGLRADRAESYLSFTEGAEPITLTYGSEMGVGTGVPAFFMESGKDFLGDTKAQMGQFTLNLGHSLADAPTMPAWQTGDPFGTNRKKEQ